MHESAPAKHTRVPAKVLLDGMDGCFRDGEKGKEEGLFNKTNVSERAGQNYNFFLN